MLVSELEGISDQGHENILAETKLWHHDASSLSDIKLLTAYILLKNRVGHDIAQRAIKHVIQSVKRAEFFGLIRTGADIDLKLSKPVLTIKDFNDHLEQMNRLEKRAFLFALGSGLDLHEIQTLTWEQALRMKRHRKLNKIAVDIIKSSVRNIKLNYVFWQLDRKGNPIPFFDVEHTLNIITKKKWHVYRSEFFNMPDRPF